MDNKQIAKSLDNFASLMELRGDDEFRSRSYRYAAETIETWPIPLEKIAAQEGLKGLQTLPGIGRAIAGKIVELLEKGTFEAWGKLTAEIPETVLELLDINGIGPKTAQILYKQFNISSMAQFREFVAGGGLEMVGGIGEKTAKRIVESLKHDITD